MVQHLNGIVGNRVYSRCDLDQKLTRKLFLSRSRTALELAVVIRRCTQAPPAEMSAIECRNSMPSESTSIMHRDATVPPLAADEISLIERFLRVTAIITNSEPFIFVHARRRTSKRPPEICPRRCSLIPTLGPCVEEPRRNVSQIFKRRHLCRNLRRSHVHRPRNHPPVKAFLVFKLPTTRLAEE